MFKRELKYLVYIMLLVMVFGGFLAGCAEEDPEVVDDEEVDTEEPIKVGLLTPLTGTFAANGIDMRDGLQMFLDERDGTLGGRPVELIIEDTEGDPGTAVTKARRLVEMDEVDVITGPLLASSGYAVAEYAMETDFPFLVSVVSAEDLTQRDRHDKVIRTGWSSAQPMHPFAEYAYEELGYRKVAMIAYDFAFGHETMGGFHYTFEEMGGEVVEKLWPPIGTPDYSPYLESVPADVDAVVANFSGADALRFVEQYEELGFKGEIPLIGAGTLTDEHVLVSMGDEAEGIVTALHYSAALDTPENQEFVENYMASHGRIPSYYVDATYSSMAVLEAGIEAVGGLEDWDAFREAIIGTEVESARGTFYIDEYNNPVQDIFIREVEIVDGELENTVIHSFEEVSQFWTYDPEDFLERPVYDRDYPPVN